MLCCVFFPSCTMQFTFTCTETCPNSFRFCLRPKTLNARVFHRCLESTDSCRCVGLWRTLAGGWGARRGGCGWRRCQGGEELKEVQCAQQPFLRLKANLLRHSLAAHRLLEGSLFDCTRSFFLRCCSCVPPHEAADDVWTALPAALVFQ